MIVHNKHERVARLLTMIVDLSSCRVSDVKRDGTIVIRFLSTNAISAIELTESFREHLTSNRIEFVQVDDVRLRFQLPK